MSNALTVDLAPEERDRLDRIVKTHELAYMRERAAAILKLDWGRTVPWIAEHGLLQRRDEGSVRGWVHRYKEEGIDGLFIREGRGRKPAFSP